jgi:hypothetical protein
MDITNLKQESIILSNPFENSQSIVLSGKAGPLEL